MRNIKDKLAKHVATEEIRALLDENKLKIDVV